MYMSLVLRNAKISYPIQRSEMITVSYVPLATSILSRRQTSRLESSEFETHIPIALIKYK